jgi:cytochrome c oxidase subunit 2
MRAALASDRSRNRRRVFALALAASVGGALALATGASADLFTPESGGSPNANDIDTLYKIILAVAVVIFVGVEGMLVYSLVKFRVRKDAVPAQIRGNTRLEIGWTLGATVVLVVLAVVTFAMLGGIRTPPNSDAAGYPTPVVANVKTASAFQPRPPSGRSLNITVNGQRYVWRYTYPDADDIALNNVFSYVEMVVPTKTTVTLDIEAQDVAHSWWIPQLGGKADAIPGHTNFTWFKIEKPGVYRGQCAELCGRNHADMVAQVRAIAPAAFKAWLVRKKAVIAENNAAALKRRQTDAKQNASANDAPSSSSKTPASEASSGSASSSSASSGEPSSSSPSTGGAPSGSASSSNASSSKAP